MKKITSFENLVKKDAYQVFLFTCPAHIPLSIWTHPWFVINKKGILIRFEVRYKRNYGVPGLGHIHINDLPMFEGIEVFSMFSHPRWNATLVGSLEGREGSLAQRMCEFIENSATQYKDKNRYSLFGPNSNTYAQWVLDNSPEFKGKLPWSAVGK